MRRLAAKAYPHLHAWHHLFRERALSKDCGENRFKQLVKKVGEEKAMAMLKGAEEGFKENYALLKKLAEM